MVCNKRFNKKNFIFIECVFNAHHDATEKMLKKATSEMLRAAPDRRGGGGRPLRTER